MSAPAPKNAGGSTPVIVAIILVLGLAIMYLFTRIRKQDQVVERLRKENQQQLNDQDILQLTKRYVQSQECHAYLQETVVPMVAPLVDMLCLTYVNRQYPVLAQIQQQHQQQQSLYHAEASPMSEQAHFSEPLQAPPSVQHFEQIHISEQPPQVEPLQQQHQMQIIDQPQQVEPLQQHQMQIIEQPQQVEPSQQQHQMQIINQPQQVEPLQQHAEVVESVAVPHVQHSEQKYDGEHLDEQDLSEPGSTPDSSSPSQIVSNSVSAESSPEITPRKKPSAGAKKPAKKRPTAVKKKAGSRA